MDYRRGPGGRLHSGYRFSSDPEPAEAERKLDSHPNPYSDSNADGDPGTYNYTTSNYDYSAHAVSAHRTDVYTLADEYGESVTCHCEECRAKRSATETKRRRRSNLTVNEEIASGRAPSQ